MAILVHRRHADLVSEWGGSAFPWVYFQRESIVVNNIYLPNMCRSEEEWTAGILSLRQVVTDNLGWDALLVLGGDFNLVGWQRPSTSTQRDNHCPLPDDSHRHYNELPISWTAWTTTRIRRW